MRDDSKPITDAGVWRAIMASGKAATAPRRLSYDDSAYCACGAHVVTTRYALEAGADLHSRRRCVLRKLNKVVSR